MTEIVKPVNPESVKPVDPESVIEVFIDEVSPILARSEPSFNADLLRDEVIDRLGENLPENLDQYRKIKRKIVKKLRKKGFEVSDFFRHPGEEVVSVLQELRPQRKALFPGEVNGVSTYELTQIAAGMGLLRYDRDFFRQLLSQNKVDKEMAEKALKIEADLSTQTEIVFPGINDGYGNLVEGIGFRRINFVGVGCPNYLEGYRLGEGISDQAQLYIDNVPEFIDVLGKIGVEAAGSLLIADTEDDLPEALGRLTDGDVEMFKAGCEASAEMMQAEVDRIVGKGLLSCGLLMDFDPRFRERQYRHESQVGDSLSRDDGLRNFVMETSRVRKDKYQEILGRDERDCELTIRYIAQYRSLAERLRELVMRTGELYILFNYQTPNLAMVNRGVKPEERIPVLKILSKQ